MVPASGQRVDDERISLQKEIAELQRRLVELMDQSQCLQQQIQQEEHQAEAEELESSVLRSCTAAQLRGLSKALQDLVSSESRRQMSVLPPASKLRSAHQLRSSACKQTLGVGQISCGHPWCSASLRKEIMSF